MRGLALAKYPHRDAVHIGGMVVIARHARRLPPLALDALGSMPQLQRPVQLRPACLLTQLLRLLQQPQRPRRRIRPAPQLLPAGNQDPPEKAAGTRLPDNGCPGN